MLENMSALLSYFSWHCPVFSLDHLSHRAGQASNSCHHSGAYTFHQPVQPVSLWWRDCECCRRQALCNAHCCPGVKRGLPASHPGRALSQSHEYYQLVLHPAECQSHIHPWCSGRDDPHGETKRFHAGLSPCMPPLHALPTTGMQSWQKAMSLKTSLLLWQMLGSRGYEQVLPLINTGACVQIFQQLGSCLLPNLLRRAPALCGHRGAQDVPF